MRLLSTVLLAAAFAAAVPAQQPTSSPKGRFGPEFVQEPFGKLPDGSPITAYTLINANGLRMKAIDYGTLITELYVPDKNGTMADVVLGFDNLESYLKGHPHFGANAGRNVNRIANAAFQLDGKTYKLAANNGPHNLHGGKMGFDKRVWKADAFIAPTGPAVRFNYTSKDGEEGFPGTLSVTISYTLTDNDEVVIDFRAATNKPTICSLANHSYFNLSGQGAGDVLGEKLQVFAKNYTPNDATLVPTGKIVPVAGTPFDFTKPKPLGQDIQAAGGKPVGYDLNYVLDAGASDRPQLAARVTDPKSGRVLEVWTTEPGIQLYTGNFLDGTLTGKGGSAYKNHTAFCLEAQKFPDAIHHIGEAGWASPVLRPGETYKQTTIYKFSVAK